MEDLGNLEERGKLRDRRRFIAFVLSRPFVPMVSCPKATYV